jgi:hypothetical protein
MESKKPFGLIQEAFYSFVAIIPIITRLGEFFLVA